MSDKSLVNIAVLGHTGHGKTTLMSAIQKVASMEDGFQKCITDSTSCIEYETPKMRCKYVEQANNAYYIRAMMRDESKMNGAILVVSAVDGILSQTREHALLARQVGVSNIVVFINKVDLVDMNEQIDNLEKEIKDLLNEYDLEAKIVKGSALNALELTSKDINATEYECIREVIAENVKARDALLENSFSIVDSYEAVATPFEKKSVLPVWRDAERRFKELYKQNKKPVCQNKKNKYKRRYL